MWTSNTLSPGLKTFTPKLDHAVGLTVDFFSPRVESAAKDGAPWTDQTGNARNTLTARPFHETLKKHGIVLAHGMPYGIWLEVRFGGRYAIILPTIKQQGIEVMATLRQVFSRMK